MRRTHSESKARKKSPSFSPNASTKQNQKSVSLSPSDNRRPGIKEKVGTDVNPRCPERLISPIPPNGCAKKLQFVDDDDNADTTESMPTIITPRNSDDSEDTVPSTPEASGRSRNEENEGTGKKKIQFKPKSKTKIPTSPVGSVCSKKSNMNDTFSDEDSLSRMMRSHMSLSVASDESTRRRMLRNSKLKTSR